MKTASWTLTLALAAAWATSSAAQMQRRATTQVGARAPRIVVNGRVVQTDVAPRIMDGTTLVPVRFVAEALGAEVTWDPGDREAVIVYEGQRVVVQEGQDYIVAGTRTIQTRVPTQVIQGRTMIPLRAVAESLDAEVRWEPATRTVVVRTPEVDGTQPSPADVLRQSLSVDLRTGQDTYQVGAPIEMTLRLQNTGNEPVRLQMATGQQYDFVVQRDGQEIWRWSQDRVFTQALTSLTLAPDETRTFTVTWNQRDNQGNPVPPGTYTLAGRVTHMAGVPLQDQATITIVRP